MIHGNICLTDVGDKRAWFFERCWQQEKSTSKTSSETKQSNPLIIRLNV